MTEAETAKLLVVDDDEASRYYKRHVLSKHGYRVSEAATGAAALQSTETERPALVMLDVRLPDASGIQICRQIKAQFPGTIVLQTSAAFRDSKDRTAGLEGGADSYIVEPVEPEELLAVIGSLLRMRRAEQELRLLNEVLEQRVAERTRSLVEANRLLAVESERRAKAEETLRHVEKLEALGQLTGGVAHDFNNLLTVVLGNLDLIGRQLQSDRPVPRETVDRLLAAALRAAQDCSRLTRQMLSFARRDVVRLELVSPNEVISRFEPLLRRALGEQYNLTFALWADALRCRIDCGQLEAALLNLVINARDAMPNGGDVRVEARNVTVGTAGELGSPSVPLAAEVEPGEYVRISVRDGGGGMTPGVLAHAFEPFFTTKDVGQGSGLGLSQVYGFVRQSEGFITVDTKPGAGTTINLYLPGTQAKAASAASAPPRSPSSRGSETILLVEDNDLVREVASATLTELGYHVLFASHGPAALEIIRGDQPIDLLFTDVVLPRRMSGFELAREAQRLRAGLKVLITSGYSNQLQDADAGDAEFPLLAKPYRHQDLAAKLREVLAAS